MIDRTHRAGLKFLCSVGLAAWLCACAPGTQDEQQVVANAIAAEREIAEAADDRADHLDERSAELAEAANLTVGERREALRNQSGADRREAEAIRAQGDAAGATRADQIEREGGVLNRQQ